MLSSNQLNIWARKKCFDLKYFRVTTKEAVIEAIEAHGILKERPERVQGKTR